MWGTHRYAVHLYCHVHSAAVINRPLHLSRKQHRSRFDLADRESRSESVQQGRGVRIMPTAPQIDAPLSLCNLFPNDDSDEEGNDGIDESTWDPCYEVQSVVLAGQELQIRQFAFHSHNANRVWPGTFNLVDYLLKKKEGTDIYQHSWGSVLELGTATGILGLRLALASSQYQRPPSPLQRDVEEESMESSSVCCSSVVTSDVVDEQGDVEANVAFNFALNGYANDDDNDENLPCRPLHIPHTWGTGWKKSVARQLDLIRNRKSNSSKHDIQLENLLRFDTIVASDILLYVSAYDALVETLCELMPPEIDDCDDNQQRSSSRDHYSRFVMSWNRRMKESAAFFYKMKQAGFDVTHEGKCIYTFVRQQRAPDQNDAEVASPLS